SAPKATSRMISVTGSDEYSARWKSLLRVSLSSWFALANPNSATVKPVCRSWAAATASRTGSIFLSALSWSPLISNWTSAERRSSETWPLFPAASGDRTFCTCGRAETLRTTSVTADRKPGSASVCVLDSIRTLSPAWFGKPARSRICSARLVSPAAVSFCFSIFVPATEPRATATTQKPSQPARAVFQRPALQRPARAARLKLISRLLLSFLARVPGWAARRNGAGTRAGVRESLRRRKRLPDACRRGAAVLPRLCRYERRPEPGFARREANGGSWAAAAKEGVRGGTMGSPTLLEARPAAGAGDVEVAGRDRGRAVGVRPALVVEVAEVDQLRLARQARHVGEQVGHRDREPEVDERLGDLSVPDPERAVARHAGDHALAGIDDAQVVQAGDVDTVADELRPLVDRLGLAGGEPDGGRDGAERPLAGRQRMAGRLDPGSCRRRPVPGDAAEDTVLDQGHAALRRALVVEGPRQPARVEGLVDERHLRVEG